MSADRPAKGIRRTGSGWQVYVRVKGEYRSKHFPPDTDLLTLKAHRDSMKARGWLAMPEPERDEHAPTFARDCQTYLSLVTAMPTYKDRHRIIHQWASAFGPTITRAEITSVLVRQQLERWRHKGLSHGSLNLRRTALMHLFSVLEGKSGTNPVRDVPRYRETPKPITLPTIKQAEKAIKAFAPTSKSRARLMVLLWTGWPPAQLMRLTAKDINYKARTARLEGRRKGKGTPARVLPLLPQAVAALRRLDALKAYGPFSTHSLRSRLRDACKRAKVKPFTVYALRHLFLTTVALATKDDRVVAELAMHSDLGMARRYTEQSVNPRLTEGMRRVQQAVRKRA